MMKGKQSSEAEILENCRVIVAEEGLERLTMRRVAQKTGIAVGALYHYFDDKESLLAKTIGLIWQEILRDALTSQNHQTLTTFLKTVSQAIQVGEQRYPHFLSDHGKVLSAANHQIAQHEMIQCFAPLDAAMKRCLEQDEAVAPGRFDDPLSLADFVLVIKNLLMQSLSGKGLTIDQLGALVDRYLYR